MKKRGQYKEKLISALEVPSDLANRDTIVTVTGKNQAVVENYRCILCYTREKIVILTFHGRLTFCGKCLEIPFFAGSELKIQGYIWSIHMDAN